jgi:hypothetical protein
MNTQKMAEITPNVNPDTQEKARERKREISPRQKKENMATGPIEASHSTGSGLGDRMSTWNGPWELVFARWE